MQLARAVPRTFPRGPRPAEQQQQQLSSAFLVKSDLDDYLDGARMAGQQSAPHLAGCTLGGFLMGGWGGQLVMVCKWVTLSADRAYSVRQETVGLGTTQSAREQRASESALSVVAGCLTFERVSGATVAVALSRSLTSMVTGWY